MKLRHLLIPLVLVPLVLMWALMAVNSWRPQRLTRLPMTAFNGSTNTPSLSPSAKHLLIDSRFRTANHRWQVLRTSDAKTIYEHTSSLWEEANFLPGETGIVALELEPEKVSTRDETFYRPAFQYFSGGGIHYGQSIAVEDSSVPSTPAMSPDGKSVFGLFSREVAQWDIATGKLIRLFRVGSPLPRDWSDVELIQTRLFQSGGQQVFSQGTSQFLEFWDLAKQQRLYRVPMIPGDKPSKDRPSIPYYSANISFDAGVLAVVEGSEPAVCRVCDLKTGRELWSEVPPSWPGNCWFDVRGKEMLFVTAKNLEIREPRTGKVLKSLPPPKMNWNLINPIVDDWFYYIDGGVNLCRQRLH